jgi:hypothetical protein
MFGLRGTLRSAVVAVTFLTAIAAATGLLALAPWQASPPAGAQAPAYFAELTGTEAVPPNDSEAIGTFVAQIEGETVSYRLRVSSVFEAMFATLQIGDPDELGEVVSFVFEPAAASVEGPTERSRQLGVRVDIVSSVDVSGRITSEIGCGFQCGARLLGSLQGDIEGLLREFAAGNAHVVVVTTSYREGELRGRVEATRSDDPRVIAALAADDATRGPAPEQTMLAERLTGNDDGFPAWAWAVVVGAVVFSLVGASMLPRRRR